MKAGINVVIKVVVEKITEGVYGYSVMHGFEELFDDDGFSSIAQALASAAGETAEFLGCEVSFSGITAGTFHPSELADKSEVVAQICVENAARFLAY